MPRLSELPAPPPGRTGWPWTEEWPHDSSLAADELPVISVVTPSYMQGGYIEATIRSVLLQHYPKIEYFIMDGGSTDETVEVIKKYEPWLAGWVSEKDRGQADAINKGWKSATGSLVAWINSDDWFQPGAFHAVARHFVQHPETGWLCGIVDDCDVSGRVLKRHRPALMTLAGCMGRRNYGIQQPGVFWRRSLVDETGLLDESMHCCFDHELFVRILGAGHQMGLLDEPVAFFRRHPASKSSSRRNAFLDEDREVFARHQALLPDKDRRLARTWLRQYEAEHLPGEVYGLLAGGRRREAISRCIAGLPLAPFLSPPRLFLGMLFRCLLTGRPPEWFRA